MIFYLKFLDSARVYKQKKLLISEELFVPPSTPNINEILDDTRAYARIWDLYGHLIKESQNSLTEGKSIKKN